MEADFIRILPSIIQFYIFCNRNVKKEYFWDGLFAIDSSKPERNIIILVLNWFPLYYITLGLHVNKSQQIQILQKAYIDKTGKCANKAENLYIKRKDAL